MIGSSTTHNVTWPSHAAELLLNGWPEQDGPAYRKAKEGSDTPDAIIAVGAVLI